MPVWIVEIHISLSLSLSLLVCAHIQLTSISIFDGLSGPAKLTQISATDHNIQPSCSLFFRQIQSSEGWHIFVPNMSQASKMLDPTFPMMHL